MGRPRLTAEELRARGCAPGTPNYNRYRDRLKADKTSVAAPAAIPREPLRKSPPKHMVDKQQRELWSKIVNTAPSGALGASDEIAVELAVCLYQKLLKNELKPSEAAQFKAILLSFGMFPTNQNHQNPTAPVVPTPTPKEKAMETAKRLLAR